MNNSDFYKMAWQFAMNELHEEYKAKGNEEEFLNWFKMEYKNFEDNTIFVVCPSSFLKQFMASQGYFDIVLNKIKKNINQDNIKIQAVVEESAQMTAAEKPDYSFNESERMTPENQSKKTKPVDEDNSKGEIKTEKKHPNLMEEFTFETFVPGDNSNFAYNAGIAVAKNPGKQYNPVLLYGGSGLGKTHLMQAIGNYIYSQNPKMKICYVPSETLMNEFTSTLAQKRPDAFKNKYRNLDVLLLDDIQFLSGKPGLQEELFYTFNALHEKKAQMVFTCDRPIREVKNMTERLVSRLSNGVYININIPNFETRCAILKKKIEQMHKSLDEEIVTYIAQNIETNVRDLESALQQVFALSELTDKEPTMENVKEQLKNTINMNYDHNISLDIIQKVIADNYQISISDLKSKKRDKKYVVPRQIAIYISRELTEISYSELGNEFGGKDHSTIMHAYSKVAEEIKTDPIMNSKIQLLIKEIKEYKKL